MEVNMAQIIGIAVTIILALIGTVWGVTRAMGKMVVKHLEASLTELKNELASIRKELREVSDDRIRNQEQVRDLAQRVTGVEKRVEEIEKESRRIRELHIKHHPDELH
jgi:demethoxyubiquinone hydroxylase (CLK1/Coq7/Cat5 family)